jgi:leader peptidase (prepilin peptidase)/N-methyltransferase
LALMAYRIPRKLSIITPRSFCDSCKKQISAWNNIPLVSYLVLKGKSRCCGAKIPWRYPAIELITAILFVYAYEALFLDYYSLVRVLLLVTAIMPSIFIDADERIIPDRFSIGLIVCGFVLALLEHSFSPSPSMTWHDSAAGIVVGGGLLFIVAEVYYRVTGREGLGGGDIKLLAGIGALLGWYPALMVIFFSSVLGSLYGILMMVAFKKGRLTEIPFGPFIGASAILYYFITGRVI